MSALATKDDVDAACTRLGAELRRDLASKQDLANAIDGLRTELRRDLASKQDLADTAAALRGEIAGLRHEMTEVKRDLTLEIGRAATQVANVMAEHFRSWASAVDDKYRHLPHEVAALRADLDEHRADATIHGRRRR